MEEKSDNLLLENKRRLTQKSMESVWFGFVTVQRINRSIARVKVVLLIGVVSRSTDLSFQWYFSVP
jgi:hypothetical protein